MVKKSCIAHGALARVDEDPDPDFDLDLEKSKLLEWDARHSGRTSSHMASLHQSVSQEPSHRRNMSFGVQIELRMRSLLRG